MSDFVVEYDLDELGEYSKSFPKDVVTRDIMERLLFMTPEEARGELKIFRILDKIVPYDKSYRLEYIDLEVIPNSTIVLYVKVKDKNGLTVPKLIPYGKVWFLVGTGPCSKFFDIELCLDMDDYCSAYKRLFDGEYDFAYFCTMNQNLEIIDWHTFYDYYDKHNQQILEEVRKIIAKKYPEHVKYVNNG